MTQEELLAKIKAEIERLKGICTAQIKANPGQTFPFVMEMTGYDKVLSFLPTLESENPVPNDLEEAAWDCVLDSVDVNNPVLLPKYKELLTYLFIDGAKWQKEQMMKEAVECLVCAGMEGDKWIMTYIGSYESMLKTCKAGDKVRVIVLPKED